MSLKMRPETSVALNARKDMSSNLSTVSNDTKLSFQKAKKTEVSTSGGSNTAEDSHRSNSFSSSRKRRWSCNYNKDNAFFKRKRSHSCVSREEKIQLPTKFLLGGSIADPLNLNGLTGQSLSNMSPISSPWQASPKSIDVVIPPNITDPLNLNCVDYENGKRRKRHRHKKKEEPSNDGQLITPIGVDVSYDIDPEMQSKCLSAPVPSTSNLLSPQFTPTSRRRRRTVSECTSDLVSAKELKFNKPQCIQSKDELLNKSSDSCTKASSAVQSGKKKKSKFIHGNYNRYYGYRNPVDIEDSRLEFFQSEWFSGKDVLDIGCNVGHLTILVAKKYSPQKVVGLDIDSSLISAARKNIRYYMEDKRKNNPVYPTSSKVVFGPVEAPPLTNPKEESAFPTNIIFKQGNYVLQNDDQLSLVKEEYDTILALSISKWIHLNNGDEGIRLFFKRIHKHLRPGGRLILEPQPWASYKKRKNLTPTIHNNFQNIRLKPEQFREYLLAEIGFHKCEVIDVSNHKSKGFRRPIQVYTKSE